MGGLELYDSIIKTRHNGTVFGKRYFVCPRNKGLFVQRSVILKIIKAQNLKKTLKELERRQIERKKLNDRRRKIKKKTMQKQGALALYQSRTKMSVAHDFNEDNIKEQKIKNDFKRFQRISFLASNNPELVSMAVMDNETKQNESDEVDDVDIDNEAWDSLKERPILQILDDDENIDLNGNECKVRLFYSLKHYVLDWEHVIDKGLMIKDINSGSKQGRALILECGIQANCNWFIQKMNGNEIGKCSKDAVDEIVNGLVTDIGYDIVLKKE